MEWQLNEQRFLKPVSIQLHIESFSLIFLWRKWTVWSNFTPQFVNVLDFFGSNAVNGSWYSPQFHHRGEIRMESSSGGNQQSALASGSVEAETMRLGCRWSQNNWPKQDQQQDWIFAVDSWSTTWLLEENGQVWTGIRAAAFHPPCWVIPQIWDMDYF